jgi:hypothetical protein
VLNGGHWDEDTGSVSNFNATHLCFLKAGHFSTLVPMAGVIGRLASRITVPHWRTQRFPTAAAAAEFGVAGVVLATSLGVAEERSAQGLLRAITRPFEKAVKKKYLFKFKYS